uniref:Putative oxygenase n=1 Tax=Streptomyces griseoviridis TaxID=45398 RepID=B6VRR2_STRGD|nr:putative oxygenase [Streptomyces griseoviridis]
MRCSPSSGTRWRVRRTPAGARRRPRNGWGRPSSCGVIRPVRRCAHVVRTDGGPRHLPRRPLVREQAGLVWLWWGAERETYPEPWLPPEVGRRPGVHVTSSWERPVSPLRYQAGLLDLYHAPDRHHGWWYSRLDYAVHGTLRALWFDGRARYLAGCELADHRLDVDGDTVRSSFRLAQRGGDPALDERFTLVITPGMVHVQSPRLDFTVWLTPVDHRRTLLFFRWYEVAALAPYLRFPLLRAALPALMMLCQRLVPARQIVRMAAGAPTGATAGPAPACRRPAGRTAPALPYAAWRGRAGARRPAAGSPGTARLRQAAGLPQDSPRL